MWQRLFLLFVIVLIYITVQVHHWGRLSPVMDPFDLFSVYFFQEFLIGSNAATLKRFNRTNEHFWRKERLLSTLKPTGYIANEVALHLVVHIKRCRTFIQNLYLIRILSNKNNSTYMAAYADSIKFTAIQ